MTTFTSGDVVYLKERLASNDDFPGLDTTQIYKVEKVSGDKIGIKVQGNVIMYPESGFEHV